MKKSKKTHLTTEQYVNLQYSNSIEVRDGPWSEFYCGVSHRTTRKSQLGNAVEWDTITTVGDRFEAYSFSYVNGTRYAECDGYRTRFDTLEDAKKWCERGW